MLCELNGGQVGWRKRSWCNGKMKRKRFVGVVEKSAVWELMVAFGRFTVNLCFIWKTRTVGSPNVDMRKGGS